MKSTWWPPAWWPFRRQPAPPPPIPAPHRRSADAAELLSLVNAFRAEHGFGTGAYPLRLDARLIVAARRESDDCAAHRRLDHTSSDGKSPFQRMTEAGYPQSFAAENIAMGQPDPAAVVAAWASHLDHRRNMLGPLYVDVGFAVAYDDDWQPYWTADFATTSMPQT